jgi:hypothetical protein
LTAADDDDHDNVVEPSDSDGVVNVTVGGHAFTVVFNNDGSVNIGGVTGSSNGLLHTDIAVFAENDYNELQFDYVSGTAFQVGNFGAAVPSTDPVDFSVPISIMDGDGDILPSGDIDIHVNGTGPSNLVAQNFSALSVEDSNSTDSLVSGNTTQGFKTALAPSNDNSGASNAALLGAIAAAGLAASHDVAAHSVDDHRALHEARVEARAEDHAQTLSAIDRPDHGGRGGERHDTADAGRHEAVAGRHAAHHDEVQSQQHEAGQHHQSAPAELLQGTQAAAPAGDASHSPVTAAAIAMPSAEQLAAVSGSAEPQAQHDQVVGKVLAAALQGGGHGHGPSLDALINSLPEHGPHAGLDALASHGPDAVSHGHTAFAGVFSTGHNVLGMDHMAVHHDAPPPHA